MKKMIAGIALAVAVSVSASPHKTTDSIMVWTDASGGIVAPYSAFSSTILYVDQATGHAWALRGVRTSTPYVAASVEATNSDLGLLYATTNCTGAAYLNAPTDMPRLVRISAGDGQLYADGDLASVTIRSRWVGYCITENIAGPVYVAVGPLTAPTLPAGPYHLEVR